MPRRPKSRLRVAVIACAAAMLLVSGCAAQPVATAAISGPADSLIPVSAFPVHIPSEDLDGGCATQTVMSVWAHYDDDLIFRYREISDAIQSGDCVRSVFMTCGDAGRGREYSWNREQGIRDAYDMMRGSRSPWVQYDVRLDSGMTVDVWRPSDDPRVTLVFLRLPDGNLDGSGFDDTHDMSLAKLASGRTQTIVTLDGAVVTWDEVARTVTDLIRIFAPDRFSTHVPGDAEGWARGDHADHAATGTLARSAWQAAGLDASQVSYAVGYQTADYPANVAGSALAAKLAVFLAYSAHDAVPPCRDASSCLVSATFGAWLQREYARSESELSFG